MECTEYKKLDNGLVECTCCAHHCVIKNGKTGICHIRNNIDGTLFLKVYGKPSCVHVDPIEKKPLYHFFPGSEILSLGTIGCNFKCQFCENWSLSMEEDLEDQIRGWSPEEVVNTCISKSLNLIAYTYNEPTTWFEYNEAISLLAKKHGMKIVYVTNGYMSENVREKLLQTVDALNIDLKCFKDSTYKTVMGGGLEVVKQNIEFFYKHGKEVEVTTLLVPEMNDSEDEIEQLTQWLASVSTEIPWHVSAFHPDYKMNDRAATSPDAVKRACEIGRKNGLLYIYAGNCRVQEFRDTVCSCGAVLVNRKHYDGQVVGMTGSACKQCGKTIYGEFK